MIAEKLHFSDLYNHLYALTFKFYINIFNVNTKIIYSLGKMFLKDND